MIDESPGKFIDTNILVYAHDNSAGQKQDLAQELIKELWESRAGCLSIQVLQEFYVGVTMKVPDPLLPEAAAVIINDLTSWRVHRPDGDDLLAAIDKQIRYRISFWDSMVIQSAQSLGCEILFSENFNAEQRYDGVLVVNPFGVGG
jgi:predicted nucleic acid-binding protein